MTLILVTHQRDWPMVMLLAQSLTLYMEQAWPLWVTNTDQDPGLAGALEERLVHLLAGRELRVFSPQDWPDISASPEPQPVGGWIDQQQYKIAMSAQQDPHVDRVLVLDSQNFLIRPWAPSRVEGVPCRSGQWAMNRDILGGRPSPGVSISTPMYMAPRYIREMIRQGVKPRRTLAEWSRWFVSRPHHTVSEFYDYVCWVQDNHSWQQTHTLITDWAFAYLRDTPDPQDWARMWELMIHALDYDYWGDDRGWCSINHRAWQQMTDREFEQICDLIERRRFLALDREGLRSMR